jgi:hypothetical protein
MMASMPDDHIPLMLGPADAQGKQADPPEPLNKQQQRLMVKRFNAESRRRRRLFKKELQRDWESQVAPAFDQENGNPAADSLLDEEVAYHDFMTCRLDRFDEDLVCKKDYFLDDLRHASLSYGLTPDGGSRSLIKGDLPDELVLQRTAELWAGLRRVYFGEVEESSDPLNAEPIPRTRQSMLDFKAEIAETRARIRQRVPRAPDALNLPLPSSLRRPDDDPGDSQVFPIFPGPPEDSDENLSESQLSDSHSNGEDKYGGRKGDTMDFQAKGEFEVHYGKISLDEPPNGESKNTLLNEEDKNEINGNFLSNGEKENTIAHFSNFVLDDQIPNGEIRNLEDPEDKNMRPKVQDQGWLSKSKIKFPDFGIRKALLSSKTIRRILNFKESILKYGVFVPRNENESDASPEHLRWSSGRQLEWMRLQEQGTFERNWD